MTAPKRMAIARRRTTSARFKVWTGRHAEPHSRRLMVLHKQADPVMQATPRRHAGPVLQATPRRQADPVLQVTPRQHADPVPQATPCQHAGHAASLRRPPAG